MPGNSFNPKDRNVRPILGVSDARLLGIIGAASCKAPLRSARFGDGFPAAGHAGVTRGQLETKESDMNRYATLLITTLAVLGLADAAKADWGFLAYGGCQPWWNPLGIGKRHGQKVEERRLQRF